MVLTLLPAFSADILHSPEIGYSALNVVVSIGSVIGGILNVWLGRRFGHGRVVITMLIILPVLSLAFTLAAALLPALGLIGLIGLGYTSFFVTTNVLIQSEVEDAYRGRVFSLWSLNRFGLSPMGALVIGSVAEITGLQITMIGCSLVAAVFGVWLLSRAAGVRHLS